MVISKYKKILYILALFVYIISLITFYTNINKYLSLLLVFILLAISIYIYSCVQIKKISRRKNIVIFFSSLIIMFLILNIFDAKFFSGRIDNFLFFIDVVIPLKLYAIK